MRVYLDSDRTHGVLRSKGWNEKTWVWEGEAHAVDSKAVQLRETIERLDDHTNSLEGFVSQEKWVVMSDGRATRVTGTTFEAVDVPVGQCSVVAYGAGETATALVTVEANRVAHVTLRASGSARLDGVVHDARSGNPVAGVVCRWLGDAAAVTDERGAFISTFPPMRRFR